MITFGLYVLGAVLGFWLGWRERGKRNTWPKDKCVLIVDDVEHAAAVYAGGRIAHVTLDGPRDLTRRELDVAAGRYIARLQREAEESIRRRRRAQA